ncbi:hypothetical protein F444_16098 [Phytophthora nicotianae P1976]|uniref:Uncharacterized protein n=1 Tax=Phytophthora nicotianae P1976 TaxID=1317066 RepID=A0A080ZJS3_PHYNI|nr:hypothetical protein F444_16098 [Phytophthora nicotianae P1976]
MATRTTSHTHGSRVENRRQRATHGRHQTRRRIGDKEGGNDDAMYDEDGTNVTDDGDVRANGSKRVRYESN